MKNTTTFISQTDKWPIWNQTFEFELNPMEAWGEHDCRPMFDSESLKNWSCACMLFVLVGNAIGFVGWGISMGYCWSMILMLQYLVFIPLFNLYIPTCHTLYMKELGLAAGYDNRIQDNFFARSYNHTEFKDFNHTYEGAYNFRFWRMGYKYTAFIDNVADIW